MIQITPQMRILVAVEPTDFRRGIDGLARVCKEVLRHDPFSGWVFVFRNRPATALKILVYDGQGFWLCHKRLSSGQVPLVADRQTRRPRPWRPTSCKFSFGRQSRSHPGGAGLAAGRPRQLMPILVADPMRFAKRQRTDLLAFFGSGYGASHARQMQRRKHRRWFRGLLGISPGVVERYHGPSETDDHRVGHGQAGRRSCGAPRRRNFDEKTTPRQGVGRSYAYLSELVGDKNTTIARLRKLLFGAKTEKTAAVVGRRKRSVSARHGAGGG